MPKVLPQSRSVPAFFPFQYSTLIPLPLSQDFLKATFPRAYPGAMPSYLFFDKNCQLLKHLIASGDHYFDHTGLPVDVFHASNCHHETDTFCNVHCNPAKFEELIDPNVPNGWRFNSSAAEQANAWFGGFMAIVREMPIAKYVPLDYGHSYYLQITQDTTFIWMR